MTKKKIEEQVINVIVKHFDVNKDKINGKTDFKNDLDADSIDAIEVIMDLENKFNINVPDKKLEKLRTVNDVVNVIASYKDKK